ncbi:MAG: hypothetical protein V1887_02910 [Candidatus Aenigmatarchaeota archaeon]
MEPTSVIGTMQQAASGAKSIYSLWDIYKSKKIDRAERAAFKRDVTDLDGMIGEAQNRIYDTPDWKPKWYALENARTALYELETEVDRLPEKKLTLKEMALGWKDKARETMVARKCVKPLRLTLRATDKETSQGETEIIPAYITTLSEALRDKEESVEEYVRKFETQHEGTKIADFSKENRARLFAGQSGGMAADSDVVAYVSSCYDKIYRSPPDWVSFPKGRYFEELTAGPAKCSKNRTEARCGSWGIDRVVFDWKYNKLPKPREIAAEAASARRWGWLRISCMVANKFDQQQKDFIASYSNPGLLLFARETDTKTTITNNSPVNLAFLPYFTDYGKPEGLMTVLQKNSQKSAYGTPELTKGTFQKLGFGDVQTAKLESKEMILPIEPGKWMLGVA